jgi:putative flippase GtrA
MANKIFTFQLSKKIKFAEVWKYAVSSTLSYFIILSCTIILVEKYKITPFYSNFFAILINIFITYLLLKLWVFNEKIS